MEIGQMNRLQIIKLVDFGAYLDAGHLGEVLLPGCYRPQACAVGDWLDVFLYLDSDDLLVATTETPRVCVGQCACLPVVEVNRIGAFLDWGLKKDLLVPFRQQQRPMQPGHTYVVYVYLDEATDRIAASSKLEQFLSPQGHYLQAGQAVDLLICGQTDLGYTAVINNTHLGLLYKNEVFQPLQYGQSIAGIIKAIRPDKKIDLALNNTVDPQNRDALGERIIDHLQARGGLSTLTDKSAPEAIYAEFGVSKASYKKALGRLYKQQRIQLEKQRITLLD